MQYSLLAPNCSYVWGWGRADKKFCTLCTHVFKFRRGPPSQMLFSFYEKQGDPINPPRSSQTATKLQEMHHWILRMYAKQKRQFPLDPEKKIPYVLSVFTSRYIPKHPSGTLTVLMQWTLFFWMGYIYMHVRLVQFMTQPSSYGTTVPRRLFIPALQ
jgi:hypothetical protein